MLRIQEVELWNYYTDNLKIHSRVLILACKIVFVFNHTYVLPKNSTYLGAVFSRNPSNYINSKPIKVKIVNIFFITAILTNLTPVLTLWYELRCWIEKYVFASFVKSQNPGSTLSRLCFLTLFSWDRIQSYHKMDHHKNHSSIHGII